MSAAGPHPSASMRLTARLLALVLAWPLAARADDVPAPSAPYDLAIDRSLAAHARGDGSAAQRAMEEAHALEPNARTFRALGILAYERGEYPEALAALEAALVAEDRPLTPELRAGVEALCERVAGLVARVSLVVQPAGARVLADGAIPVRSARGELLLLPGERTLGLDAEGHEPHGLALDARAGVVHELHVVLAPHVPKPARPAVIAAVPAPGPLVESPARGHERPSRWRPALRRGLLGGGVPLLVAGASVWLTGYLRFQGLADKCRAQDGGGCSAALAHERFRAEHIGTLTTTGAAVLSVGAASLLAGSALALYERLDGRRIELRAQGSGLQLRAKF